MKPSKALILLLGIPGLSLAQPCKEIEDSAERLACYDARDATIPESVEHGSATREPETAPAVPVTTPAPESEPEPDPEPRTTVVPVAESKDDFGRRDPVEAPIQSIEARIDGIKKQGNIRYLVLDNGQVWREIQESRVRFKTGRKVKITEGIMNSFDLQMEGRKKIVKVKRVR